MSFSDKHLLETDKSAWANAIGPLYSEHYLIEVLGYDANEIDEMIASGDCVWLETTEHGHLFPVDQFNQDGQVIAAARELAQILNRPDVLDNYMKAAWLNGKKQELQEGRPWDTIASSPDELDPRLKLIASRMISRMSQ